MTITQAQFRGRRKNGRLSEGLYVVRMCKHNCFLWTVRNDASLPVPGWRENLTGVPICIICQGRKKRDLPFFLN